MPQSMHRAALLAVALSAPLVASCGSDSRYQNCGVTSDCAAGLVCKQSICVGPSECPVGVLSCSDTTQCGSAKICQDGCCTSVSGCATSADCSNPALPHCDATKHVCTVCAGNGQCPTGRICSAAGTCETGCAADADCKTASKPKCTAGGFCGECKVSGDCTDPARPVCAAGVCFGCSSNSDCGGATPVCNPSSKACVPCLDSQNSNGRNPACTDAAKPACVNQTCAVCAPASNNASGVNGACGAPTPACSSAGACVACLPEKNAAGTGQNGACPAATPVCDTGNTCVGCTDNAHCPGGQVCDAKACRAPALVSLTAASSTVLVGGSTTLTATLDVNAPAAIDVAVSVVTTDGGTLSSDRITIAQGSKTGQVTYNAPAAIPAGGAGVTVKASLGGVNQTATLTLSAAALALSALAPATLAIQAGATGQLTTTLNSSATSATDVALSSDNAAATVPSKVTITGSDHAAFTVTAVSAGTANVKASFGGVDKTSVVTVFAVTVNSVVPASSSAAAGATVATTVNIAAAPGDAQVHVAVSGGGTIGGGAATDITIPQGQTSGSVNVVLPASGSVVVTASANGSTQSASITVSGGGLPACAPPVVISAIYGGGGSSTSKYKCDYVELHNRSGSQQAIGGWSLQYGSATGTTIATTNGVAKLPATLNVPGGGYVLVKMSCGTSGADYPVAADVTTDTTSGQLSLSGTAGKVFLVNGATAITLASGCPSPSTAAVDFIGYGSTANCAEGGHPAAGTAVDTAAVRNSGGCAYTPDNLADFTVGTIVDATLHNAASAAAACSSICQ